MTSDNDPYQSLRYPEFRNYLGGFFISSSNELGAFESGVAARLLGVVPSVEFGGCMTLGVVGATGWLVPELRKLKKILE